MRRSLRTVAVLLGCVAVLLTGMASAGQAKKDEAAELRPGKNLIPTKVYTLKEDLKTLEAFEGLRVTDCTDGMDSVGLQDVGLMDPEIHPLWKDTKTYTHRVIGVAVTARYVPNNKPLPRRLPVAEFDKWVGKTYGEDTPEPFVPLIRKGTVLVIDEAPNADVGSIGSNNIMGWRLRGCLGVISSTTARDTDEIIAEKIPLYFRRVGSRDSPRPQHGRVGQPADRRRRCAGAAGRRDRRGR